jgi:uncharacterized protein (TIGR00290 family)
MSDGKMKKKRVILSWSSGKDSAMTLHKLVESKEYEVVTLLTTVSREFERVAMHGVRCELLNRQAKAVGLPVVTVALSRSPSSDEYQVSMKRVLEQFKKSDNVILCAFGDIFLEELRNFRERNLAQVNMNGLFPLWKRDTAELARFFVSSGFKAIITCVDTHALSADFAGRLYDETFVDDLPSGVDPCGENGEFHSFCFDGPIFDEPVAFELGEKMLRDERFMFCDLIPM